MLIELILQLKVTQLLVLALILLGIISIYLDCKKPINFPPGPLWFPVIGSAINIELERRRTGMLWKAMWNMKDRYKSGILGFKVGKDRVVITIETKLIAELYVNEDLDGRPVGPFYETRTWGLRRGIILTDEKFWQLQRRFIVRHLKEFGFARQGMVKMIENEAEHIYHDFNEMVETGGGKHILAMDDAFGVYILNGLWTMMTGKRYDFKDSEIHYLQELLRKLFENIDMIGTLFSHFPLLQIIAPSFSGYQEFINFHKKLYKFIGRELENHKENFDPSNEPRDLMDVYLREMYLTNADESFSELQLQAVCLDMFVAGSETTSKSMRFAFLYLITNQEIQHKVQQEIDSVIGRHRLPVLSDRTNMPYSEAVILEALRIFMVNTFGIPHRALRDTTLGGYHIPKDTMVIASFAGMLKDKNYFKDGGEFNPDRYLKDGKLTIPETYQPFGTGKRRCMGELMARSNLFLLMTTLLQNFNFNIPEGHSQPSLEPLDGATPSVRPYEAVVTKR